MASTSGDDYIHFMDCRPKAYEGNDLTPFNH